MTRSPQLAVRAPWRWHVLDMACNLPCLMPSPFLIWRPQSQCRCHIQIRKMAGDPSCGQAWFNCAPGQPAYIRHRESPDASAHGGRIDLAPAATLGVKITGKPCLTPQNENSAQEQPPGHGIRPPVGPRPFARKKSEHQASHKANSLRRAMSFSHHPLPCARHASLALELMCVDQNQTKINGPRRAVCAV